MRWPLKLILMITSMMMFSSPVGAVDDETINVLRISPQDERAVIKTTDGKMQVIKTGEVINSGSGLRVVEIAEGRVVFEEKYGNKIEKIIVRLVDGKQKIERIKKSAEPTPRLLAPAEKDKKARKQVSGIN